MDRLPVQISRLIKQKNISKRTTKTKNTSNIWAIKIKNKFNLVGTQI